MLFHCLQVGIFLDLHFLLKPMGGKHPYILHVNLGGLYKGHDLLLTSKFRMNYNFNEDKCNGGPAAHAEIGNRSRYVEHCHGRWRRIYINIGRVAHLLVNK